MSEIIASLGIGGVFFEALLGYLLYRFKDWGMNLFRSIEGKRIQNQEKRLKDYSGILPIDHSGWNYIYNNKEKNIDIVDDGKVFIIPKSQDGQWYVFENEPCQDGMNALLNVLRPVFEAKKVKQKLIEDYSEDKLEGLVKEAKTEALGYKNNQIEQSLFGISRIMLNRKGVAETPWCNFIVYKTDLYTRNVMHILFNKLFPNGHDEVFSSIEEIHLLYPFVFELKLSISLISKGRDGTRIILKKAPYEFFEQKDVDEKWLLYASESIGQEDLDEDKKIDLEKAVIERMKQYKISMDKKRIDFHDIFFIHEQLSVSVLTSAVVSDHQCKDNEKGILLDVNGIFAFLSKYGDSIADYCKYSLVMWLSRHCMEKA